MKFLIYFDDKRFKLPVIGIEKIMKSLAARKKTSGSVTVVFINDRQIIKLNRRFLHKSSSTDVLAFALEEKRRSKNIEGEIYVNLQAAKRQALKYRIPYYEEAARLCVHGLLHLLGYDDHSPKNLKQMWRIQESYVKGKFDGV